MALSVASAQDLWRSPLVIPGPANSARAGVGADLGGRIAEDLLYLGFQGRFLEASVRSLVRSGLVDSALADFGFDVRTAVIARAMRCAPDGRGDLCHPGLLSPGPALAFGATPLEFLRHVAKRRTAPTSARAGGLTSTDLRRGTIGWGGPRGGMMTQILAGAALAFAQRGEDRVALVFEERGALRTGGWHEGMNFAGAARVPMIVVLEGSLSRDPSDSTDVEAVATGYGFGCARVEAEEHEALFRTVAASRLGAVNGRGPTLIELVPLPREDGWALHDAFAERATAEGTLPESELHAIEGAAAAGVDHAAARLEREPGPASHDALAPVFTDCVPFEPWTRRDSPGRGPVASIVGCGAVDVG